MAGAFVRLLLDYPLLCRFVILVSLKRLDLNWKLENQDSCFEWDRTISLLDAVVTNLLGSSVDFSSVRGSRGFLPSFTSPAATMDDGFIEQWRPTTNQSALFETKHRLRGKGKTANDRVIDVIADISKPIKVDWFVPRESSTPNAFDNELFPSTVSRWVRRWTWYFFNIERSKKQSQRHIS